jgi:hypothetical protein
MKSHEMIDTNILMMHGLLDNPEVVRMEEERLEWEQKRKNIENMVERLMGIDENLSDLLLAVKLMHEKEGEKNDENS